MKVKQTVRLLVLLMIVLLAAPVMAQDETETEESPLLALLSYIPDTPENRRYVAYGDIAAWHEARQFPRIADTDQFLTLMDIDPTREILLLAYVMPSQVGVPAVLGLDYMLVESLQDFYGFDLFVVDRYIEAQGAIPDETTVLVLNIDTARVADALVATGYDESPLGDGRLFSILEDGEFDLTGERIPSRTGQLGALNRIGVFDDRVIVARSTAVVEVANDAAAGEVATLADDPIFTTAVAALSEPAVSDRGALVSVFFTDSEDIVGDGDIARRILGRDATEEQVAELRERLGLTNEGPTLPRFSLVAFATIVAEDESYLVAALVLPAGADAQAAADVLAERIPEYRSLVTVQPMSEQWTFEETLAVESGELPVALAVMSVEHEFATDDNQLPRVFNWQRMINNLDLGWLATE